MKNLNGTFTALVTPFKDGKVDYTSLASLVKQQLQGGVEGFVINGTTAESPTLSAEERQEIFKFVKSQCPPDAVLIMGTGSNSTQKTIEDTRAAQGLGADAALVVVPYYNKPPQRGLYAHFKAVSSQTEVPLLLYNVPGRTITSLSLDTIQDLAKLPHIVGIKEASGDVALAAQIKKSCGADFSLLSGDDASYVEFLGAGGDGVISVISHVLPQQLVQWKKWSRENQIEKARQDIGRYTELIRLLFVEANPIPVKKALQMLGIIESAEMRLPLVELETRYAEELKAELKKLGLLA